MVSILLLVTVSFSSFYVRMLAVLMNSKFLIEYVTYLSFWVQACVHFYARFLFWPSKIVSMSACWQCWWTPSFWLNKKHVLPFEYKHVFTFMLGFYSGHLKLLIICVVSEHHSLNSIKNCSNKDWADDGGAGVSSTAISCCSPNLAHSVFVIPPWMLSH